MIIVACVFLVCATVLVGLRMFLTHERPQVKRPEFDLVKGDLVTLEKKFVELGLKVISTEKKIKLNTEPSPVIKRADAGGGPPTREERKAQAQ